MAETANRRARRTSRSAARTEEKIWRDFFAGLAFTFLLFLLYLGVEASQLGSALRVLGYSIVQVVITPDPRPPQILVLDISDLRQTQSPERKEEPLDVTPRDALRKLISAVAALRPVVIGVDIDFSSADGGFLLPKADPPFFEAMWQISNNENEDKRVPIFLGISRRQQALEAAAKRPSQSTSNNHWLGESKYDSMAASIRIPKDKRTLIASFSFPHGVALQSMSALLAEAYAKARLEESPRPHYPPWLAERISPWKSRAGFSGSQYLVDYSALDALQASKARLLQDPRGTITWSPDVVKDPRYQLQDKIVLLGDATLGKNRDTFNLPFGVRGIVDSPPVPGVFFNALGAYSQIRPLFQLKFLPRAVIDVLLIFAVLYMVLHVRLYYHHRTTAHVAVYRLQTIGFALTILIVLSGVWAVRFTRLVWEDWLLVVLALWTHSRLERRLVAAWAWLRWSLPRLLDWIALDRKRRATSALIAMWFLSVSSISLVACTSASNPPNPSMEDNPAGRLSSRPREPGPVGSPPDSHMVQGSKEMPNGNLREQGNRQSRTVIFVGVALAGVAALLIVRGVRRGHKESTVKQ